KLIEKDKVTAIIGLSDTDLVLAAAPIAAAAQKLFITSGATSPELVRQVPEYLFLACFDDQAQAKAAANYAYQKLRLKSAYVLFDTKMAYTKILAQSFKDDYQDLGGKIIAENIFVTGQQDFSAFIKAFKKLKRKTPDMLYIAAGPEDIGQIIKQFRENNIYEPIFGGDSYDNPLIVQTAGENAHDIYFTTHTFFDEEQLSKLSQQFFKAYFQEYQTFPLNSFAALGYDTVRLLAQAITKAGKTDTPSILKALKNTEDFYGITGKITYSQSSRIPQKDITLVVIKKGHFSVKAIIN
ncbi:ABC transporter substrate-binding protein, partial [bacterium]|nr:ABC transporter substrate-binding protein [bacterium]